MKQGVLIVAAVIGALAVAAPFAQETRRDAVPVFDEAEIQRILLLGPWPQPVLPDRSNRASGNAAAIALGEALFFEPRVSGDGTLSCAACHIPQRAWTDGRARAFGRVALERNTPSLVNAGLERWFGWDGGSDSLWSFAIRPILDPRELASSPATVARLIRGDRRLSCLHEAAFGTAADDEQMMINAAKALGAFVATIASGRTPFDDFRDALARGDQSEAARYPAAAQRGLKIFVGQGACFVCHFGANFSNGEFHDIGIPFMAAPGRVDPGRHGGIKRLVSDRYNLAGPFSDDPSGASAVKTKRVELQHRNFGEFKVPSLRNVALTAPYMHDGQLASLADVVRHYSDMNEDRLHSDGERLLKPLNLSAREVDDLVAFLETLSDPAVTGPYTAVPVPAACEDRSSAQR